MDYKGNCKIDMTPKFGGCMILEGKGDFAGHVAIFEKEWQQSHSNIYVNYYFS